MKKSKVFMLVSIITLIVVIVGSASTYAWYVWSTSDTEKTKIATNVGAATVYFDGGASITGVSLRPVSDKSKGFVKEIKTKTNSSSDVKFSLYLDINSIDPELQHESFRYALYNGNTLLNEGNFSSTYLDNNAIDCTVNTGVKHIELLTKESITKTLTTYTLYIWVDGVNYTNPTSMAEKSFSFNLHAYGEDAFLQEGQIPDITETKEGSFAHQIVNIYNSSNKTEVLNNGIRYYLDTSDGLMSDIAGNVRYYGANPNNYVYFNCNDYNNPSSSTCERWRIIGVFDGKIKLVRNDSIGGLAWDQDKNQDPSLTTYSNNWETSSLQLFLNGLYYNRGNTETHTYYSLTDGSASTKLNLVDIGIKNDTTRSLIEESIWYLGGYNSEVYPNEIYMYERTNSSKNPQTILSGNPFTIVANIGLMYPSDYGYGTDFETCNEKLSKYNSSTNSYACRNNNWIYNSSINQWLISPLTYNSTGAWLAGKTGETTPYGNVYHHYHYVRPVLYLDKYVIKNGGDGSYDNPYKLNSPVESPLQLGDYVSYTPIKTSYETDPDMTGYSDVKTINPSELNLWRVLNKNADGSVEIISEYVSSTSISFYGQTGYLNLVGYLNTLAKQYKTEGITSGSRHFGYNGQTEYLEPNKVEFTNPPPFTFSTIDNSNEDKGGGDILYEKDFYDIKTVLGTRVAYRVGTSTAIPYWIASRYYDYSSSSYFEWNTRAVSASGELIDSYFFYYNNGVDGSFRNNVPIRPIVTLKPGLTYTGEGTSGSPWQIVS